MKPHWDKLAEQYAGSASSGVYDVDCTAAGKPLCTANGVEGYPTIKWGEAGSLEDYDGGREYDDLVEFTKENLKAICNPANIELCTPERQAEFAQFQAMSQEDLDTAIATADGEIKEAEDNFQAQLDVLTKEHEKLGEEKDAALAAVKEAGLPIMKSMAAFLKKSA